MVGMWGRLMALAISVCVVAAGSDGSGGSEKATVHSSQAEKLPGSDATQGQEGEDGKQRDSKRIQELQKQVNDEEVRAEIAGYASLTAINNATKQAAARKAAEAALAKAQVPLDAARASLAKTRQKVESLQAQLAIAHQDERDADDSMQATSHRANVATSQIREAQAARATAESATKAAEANELQYKDALQAAQDAAREASQKEAAMKDAAATAQRKSGEPRSYMSDFAMLHVLRAWPYQPVLGLVLGAAGLYSVVDGAVFFEAFFVIIFAGAIAILVCTEFRSFGTDLDFTGNAVVGVEAALVVAAACHYGMEGFQIIAGAVFGLAFAYGTCRFIIEDASKQVLSAVAWYGNAALIGAVGMHFGERHAHAVIGPFTGGLLFASFTVYVASFVDDYHAAASHTFLDFVEAMMTGRGALSLFGKKDTVVWACGVSVWMVVFLLGVSRHFCEWGKQQSADNNYRSLTKGHSRSDRTDPLLPPPLSGKGRPGSVHRYDEEESRRSAKISEEGRSTSRSDKKTSRKEQYNMYGQVG